MFGSEVTPPIRATVSKPNGGIKPHLLNHDTPLCGELTSKSELIKHFQCLREMIK